MELQWMPEFPELSFFDKFRLCSDFVFEHFVAIPNVLFLIFCLVLARKGKKGVLRFVPLILDLVFTAYYFVKRFIMGGLRSYDFDFLTARPEGAELAWQYAELLALLLFIASVLWILFRSDAATEKKWICAVALGSGFAVREALMLSPTMFASWHRTLIFFYFALLAVIVCLSETEESRAVLWIRRILFACGTLVNLILTIGHQFRR